MIQSGMALWSARVSPRVVELLRSSGNCSFSTASSLRNPDTSKATDAPAVPAPYLPTDIAPESPRFVHIPQAPQQTAPQKVVVKGILPVHRNLFQGDREAWAIDPEVLASRTLEPDPEKVAAKLTRGPEHVWKVRMAERRRENLRDGVFELYTRHKLDEVKKARREAQEKQEIEVARQAPEREDERLTRPTVRSEVLKLLEKNPTVPRHQQPEKVARRKRNYASREEKLTARRREGLRKLYLDARKFIVNSEQLDAAIEKEFGTDENPIQWGENGDVSVWGLGTWDSVTTLARRSLRSTMAAPTTRHMDDTCMTSGARFMNITEALVPDVKTAEVLDELKGKNENKETREGKVMRAKPEATEKVKPQQDPEAV